MIGDRFFLVDPLDGTREFVKDGEDFTVNIALASDGASETGFVDVSITNTTYVGSPDDAFMVWDDARQPLQCGPPAVPLRVVVSNAHRTPETDTWIAALEARHGACATVTIGSSLKFCLLAEARADVYPRFGRTMRWDTAAGCAVLRATGGMTFHTDGRPLTCGKFADREGMGDISFANPYFMASADGRFP